jgi:hypothetical protein
MEINMNKLYGLMILLVMVGMTSAAVYVTVNPEARLYFSRDEPVPEVPVISMIECGDGWSNSCAIGAMDGNLIERQLYHENTQSEDFIGTICFEIECAEGLMGDVDGIKDFNSVVFIDPNNDSFSCNTNACIERLSATKVKIVPTDAAYTFVSGTVTYSEIQIDFIDGAYGNYVLTAYVRVSNETDPEPTPTPTPEPTPTPDPTPTPTPTPDNSSVSGDTVVVPAGNIAWNTSVSVPTGKKITLQGAGIDFTTINMSTRGVAINLYQSGSRVTGFTIIDGYVKTDGAGWRVDHCKVYSESKLIVGVYARGTSSSGAHPTGLVDNCDFYNARVGVVGSAAMLDEKDWQHMVWTNDLDLGTGNNIVYVEDCHFDHNVFSNAVDSNYGGAYVFRYNIVNGTYIEAHSVQGDNRAVRRWEIYGNILNSSGMGIYYPYRIRGGTGVIFNDTLIGRFTRYGIALDNVRSYDARGEGGRCDGNSTWDGNEDETGYPCRDQIGRGPDVVQWNHSVPAGEYTQPLIPAYAWENRRKEDNILYPFRVINSGQDHIKSDRDYYNHNETFDGSTGVGVGLYADMPCNCTSGVAKTGE